MTLLMLADGLLTYINTPDLSMEGNPLVTRLGLGWGALTIANIIAFAAIFASAYYSAFKYKTVYTSETKLTAYWSQILFDRPDMFWRGLIPKHFAPFLAMFGFAALYSCIVSRAVVVLEWLYITFNDSWWTSKYFVFDHKYCFGKLYLIVGLVAVIVFAFHFMNKEFKKQLKGTNQALT